MHYLLGLAALVIGAVIATRRTRPTWFVVTTCVLVGLGALMAILSYTRVTDPLGLVANNILGWVFFAFALMTMLSAVFVLERRGEHGEELPPLIGDNPFDGDTDDSDDPAPGTAAAAQGSASSAQDSGAAAQGSAAAAQSAVLGGAASVGAAGAAASGSPGYASVGASGTEAFAAEAAGEPVYDTAEPAPVAAEPVHDRREPTEAAADAAAHDRRTTMQHDESSSGTNDHGDLLPDEPTMPSGDAAMESGLRASFAAGGGDPGAHTDERPAEAADDRPTASDGAEDGTTVVGADPDLATPPSETDVDAAPEGGTEGAHGTEDDPQRP